MVRNLSQSAARHATERLVVLSDAATAFDDFEINGTTHLVLRVLTQLAFLTRSEATTSFAATGTEKGGSCE